MTFVGVLLLVAGIALIVAEAHLPTHGILGAAGVGALVVSGLLLFDTDSDALEVSVPVVIVTGLVLGGLIAFAVQKALQANRAQAMTGWEELLGEVGEVRVPLSPVGQVFVEGALWRARPVDDGVTLDRGYRVRVESVDGLTLLVRPVGTEDSKPAEGAEEGVV